MIKQIVRFYLRIRHTCFGAGLRLRCHETIICKSAESNVVLVVPVRFNQQYTRAEFIYGTGLINILCHATDNPNYQSTLCSW